jgi:hypothetical protein
MWHITFTLDTKSSWVSSYVEDLLIGLKNLLMDEVKNVDDVSVRCIQSSEGVEYD